MNHHILITYILLFDKYGKDLFEYTADNILTVKNISTIIITLFRHYIFNSLNIAHCDIKENILINDMVILNYVILDMLLICQIVKYIIKEVIWNIYHHLYIIIE